MGTTANLDLPYPDPIDLVKDGAAAIQALAEAVESELYAPALRLRADAADTVDAGDRGSIVSWETVPDPGFPTSLFVRGVWTFEDDGALLIPPTPGIYLVTAQVAKATADASIVNRVETKASGADNSTAVVWATHVLNDLDAGDPAVVVTTTIVVIPDAAIGVQLGIHSDSTTNGTAAITILRLSEV